MAVTNKAKEKACESLQDYLKLIYYLGKGVMFSSQICRLMQKMNHYDKSKVWRDLRELQRREVVDIHKVHHQNYVKLKKYAIRFLLEKDKSEEIKSVSYSFTTLKRSAFLAEYILTSINLQEQTVDNLIHNILNETTLINKRNCNTLMFRNLEDFKNRELFLREEVINLEYLKEKHLNTLKNKETQEHVEKRSDFNINNMQSRNIFITKIKESEIDVVFLDLNDNYTVDRLAENVDNTYSYLTSLFQNRNFSKVSKRVNFNILTSNYFSNVNIDLDYTIKKLERKRLILNSNYTIKSTNLNLREKVFNNVNILH